MVNIRKHLSGDSGKPLRESHQAFVDYISAKYPREYDPCFNCYDYNFKVSANAWVLACQESGFDDVSG